MVMEASQAMANLTNYCVRYCTSRESKRERKDCETEEMTEHGLKGNALNSWIKNGLQLHFKVIDNGNQMGNKEEDKKK